MIYCSTFRLNSGTVNCGDTSSTIYETHQKCLAIATSTTYQEIAAHAQQEICPYSTAMASAGGVDEYKLDLHLPSKPETIPCCFVYYE